jgi:hypothetical protein
MLQWLCKCISKCFTCFRPMLQVFHLDVAYVSNICCKRLFKMFHLFQTYVRSVFIWMLWLLYTYVANVLCKCFTYFRCMLQKSFHVASLAGACRCGPHGIAVPTCVAKRSVRVACQQACGAVPTCMRINRHVVCSYMRHAGVSVQA